MDSATEQWWTADFVLSGDGLARWKNVRGKFPKHNLHLERLVEWHELFGNGDSDVICGNLGAVRIWFWHSSYDSWCSNSVIAYPWQWFSFGAVDCSSKRRWRVDHELQRPGL